MVYISKLKIIAFCAEKVEEKAKELPYFNIIVKNTENSGLCEIYKEKNIQTKFNLACMYDHYILLSLNDRYLRPI